MPGEQATIVPPGDAGSSWCGFCCVRARGTRISGRSSGRSIASWSPISEMRLDVNAIAEAIASPASARTCSSNNKAEGSSPVDRPGTRAADGRHVSSVTLELFEPPEPLNLLNLGNLRTPEPLNLI